MTILFSINFLIFVAFLIKLSTFWVNRDIAFELKTEAGKKNIKQVVIDFAINLFLFGFIPANFNYMSVFEDETQKVIACGLYLLIGTAPTAFLLWIMKIAKHKQDEVTESFKIVTPEKTIEKEIVTTTTETPNSETKQ